MPEIQRSNLAPVILQLKALGIDNIARFDFLTSPPAELVIRALEQLYSLGALDDYAKLTKPLGYRMAELALEPMMAKSLLEAARFDCLSEMLTIAAMTSLQGNVWFQDSNVGKRAQESSRRKFAAAEGDHLTLLNVYQALVTKGKKEAKWCREHQLDFKAMSRAVSIRAQLKRYLDRLGVSVDESLGSGRDKQRSGNGDGDDDDIGIRIRKCLVAGFFAHAARMQPDGTFLPVSSSSSSSGRNNQNATVLYAHPSSLMFVRTHLLYYPPLFSSIHPSFVRAQVSSTFLYDVNRD